jgi:hypothetical protein
MLENLKKKYFKVEPFFSGDKFFRGFDPPGG